jgi:hypothetical protein
LTYTVESIIPVIDGRIPPPKNSRNQAQTAVGMKLVRKQIGAALTTHRQAITVVIMIDFLAL